MRNLLLHLDDTNFEQLLETARALIPSAAPEWTDHNIHDPGIMLIELLSWIAEAQIYSLSHTRRDERLGYTRLLGMKPQGPTPASGYIWPPSRTANSADATDSAPPSWPDGTVIPADTPLVPIYPAPPAFRTRYSVLLTSAKIVSVKSHFADGKIQDWTRSNAQPGASFMPFSDPPKPADRLLLTLTHPPAAKTPDTKLLVSIGFQIKPPVPANNLKATDAIDRADNDGGDKCVRIRVVAESQTDRRRPIEVVRDTTMGLLRTGVLLLRLDDFYSLNPDASTTLIITDAKEGILKSPRIERIALNVLSVEQIETVHEQVPDFGRGIPGQQYRVGLADNDGDSQTYNAAPGAKYRKRQVLFDTPAGALNVKTIEASGAFPWELTDDLEPFGDLERKFTFDADSGIISFGNGVNGAMPVLSAILDLNYKVCAGSYGNLPKDLNWMVAGFAGVFGANSEAFVGGSDRETLDNLRQRARLQFRNTRPLVTVADLEDAALTLTSLGVLRVAEIPPEKLKGPRLRGSRVLVVVGSHVVEDASLQRDAEPSAWLNEIHDRLAPGLLLGQRLQVISPRYFPLRIRALLEAASRVNPDDVARDAEKKLRRELAIVAAKPGDPVWAFGRRVPMLAIKGWLRAVNGVARVLSVELLQERDGVTMVDETAWLGPSALPKLLLAPGDIEVQRAPLASTR